MPIQDYRALAQALNDRIRDANDLRVWQESADRAGNQAGGVMPIWQRELLSRLLALGAPIEYLTVEYFETEACRLLAFAGQLIVEARTVSLGHGEFKLESFHIGHLSSISSIDIDSTDSVPFDSIEWPARIGLSLNLPGGPTKLPLDRHASRANMTELLVFYPALLMGYALGSTGNPS